MEATLDIRRVIAFYDNTASMGQYLPALSSAVHQTSVIAQLCGGVECTVGVCWYNDYDKNGPDVCGSLPCTPDLDKVSTFLKQFSRPYGGGGIPEAFKTGFVHHVLPMCDEHTLVLHFTDAYPHMDEHGLDREGLVERDMLRDPNNRSMLRTDESTGYAYSQMRSELHEHAGFTEDWEWTSLVSRFRQTGARMVTLHTEKSMLSRVYTDLGEMTVVLETTADILQQTVDRVLETMRVDVESVRLRFLAEPVYQNHCFSVFGRHLVTPECVDALQTNPLFLVVWRCMCGMGDKERMQPIANSLSRFAASRPWLQDMLHESYRDVPGVERLLASAPERFPALFYGGSEKTVVEVMNMARLADSRAFVDLFRQCKVVTSGRGAIPLSLPPAEFLQVLAHLLCPGVMFRSVRSQWLLAATLLTTLSGDHPVHDIAGQFLESKIDASVLDIARTVTGGFAEPMNVAPMVARLVLRLPEMLTTEEMRVFYRRVLEIGGVVDKLSMQIRVAVPRRFLGRPVVTETVRCPTCSELRHPSLMPTEAKCALCISFPGVESVPPGHERPHMYECRVCHKIYQVARPSLLNVAPKCHQCRFSQDPALSAVCSECNNRFVHYGPTVDPEWVCGTCVAEPTSRVEEAEVRVLQLVRDNPQILNCPVDVMLEKRKYSDQLVKMWDTEWVTGLPGAPMLGGKLVIDTSFDDLVEQIRETEDLGTCGICFSDVPWRALDTVCGNGAECKVLACTECLESWWSRNAPGKIFDAAVCPFCRRDPKGTIWKRWNRPQWKSLQIPNAGLDPTMYHFWCVACNFVKPYVARDCTGNPPELTDQVCVECQTVRIALENAVPVDYEDSCGHRVECPGCSVLVEHLSGCNSMICECKTHFCFVCRDVWGEDENIYDHFDNTDGCPMYGLPK